MSTPADDKTPTDRNAERSATAAGVHASTVPSGDRYQPKPVSPWSYVGIRRRMRTMGGQLTLIGGAYAGALVMAVAALFVRPFLFDPYIRQRHPQPTETLAAMVHEIANGQRAAEAIDDMSTDQVAVVFGMLVDGQVADRKKNVARRLAEFQSPDIVARLRITAATGSEQQQQRAIEFVQTAAALLPPETVQVCIYIRERARRKARSILFQAADQAVKQLEAVKAED